MAKSFNNYKISLFDDFVGNLGVNAMFYSQFHIALGSIALIAQLVEFCSEQIEVSVVGGDLEGAVDVVGGVVEALEHEIAVGPVGVKRGCGPRFYHIAEVVGGLVIVALGLVEEGLSLGSKC